jgi:tetratricopeptide (TPR) repeat protein
MLIRGEAVSSWSDAVAAFVRGDHRSCLDGLLPLLASQGLQPDRCVLAAHAHAALGEAEAGLDLLARCLDEVPRSAPVWLAAAGLWMGLGRWGVASRCVERAAELAPGAAELPGLRARMGQDTAGDSLPETWQHLLSVVPPRPTLGACLIVRNEADGLADCLQSLQGCDAIVVVDTGSTDDTMTVASRWGAQVHQIAWPDDFAAARNLALGYMQTDWILVIDADEQVAGGIEAVRASIDAHGSRRTVLCPMIENRAHVPQAGTYFRAERCFARQPDIRYKGRIHERLTSADGQPLIDWAVSEWHVRHDGYRLEPWARQAKIERNQALLRRWLAEAPADPDAHYYSGLELIAAGDFRGAAAELQQAFEGYRDDASRALALLHQLQLLEMTGRPTDIITLGEAYQGLCRAFPDYWLTLGAAYASLGKSDEAKRQFEHILSLPAAEPVAFETAGARTWKPRLYLAQIAASASDGAAVLGYVEPLMAEHGDHPRIACLYFYGLVATGRTDEAEAFVVSRLAVPDVPEEFVEGVLRVLESFGEKAVPYMDRVASLPGAYRVIANRLTANEDWPGLLTYSRRWTAELGAPAWLHQGFAYWELGQVGEAEVCFGQAVSRDPELVLAWHNLGVLASRRQDWQTARLAFEGALSAGPTSFPTLVELLDVLARQGDADAAKPLFDMARNLMPEHPEVQRLAAALGMG